MSEMTRERWLQIDKLQWEKFRRANPTGNMRKMRQRLTRAMIATHGPCPPKPKTGPSWYLRLGARALGGGEGVGFLKKAWAFLNGKKTLIASILVGVPVIWDVLDDILIHGGMSAGRVTEIGAVLLLVVGWGHKIMKVFGVAAPAPPQKQR